jgi:hypothetical protein
VVDQVAFAWLGFVGLPGDALVPWEGSCPYAMKLAQLSELIRNHFQGTSEVEKQPVMF